MNEEESLFEIEGTFAFTRKWDSVISDQLNWRDGKIQVLNEKILLTADSRKLSIPLKTIRSITKKENMAIITIVKDDKEIQVVVKSELIESLSKEYIA
ncbi:MAG: hypothetical protein ACE5KE_15575 [Methanosarcinales archaeon]